MTECYVRYASLAANLQPLLTEYDLVANLISHFPMEIKGDRDGTVVTLLRYKSEGRWFDSRWCHWNFSLT